MVHLGHVLSSQGIAPDPEKIRAIVDLKVPATVKEMQSFLGMTNWFHRFIPRYSKTAAPLYAATRKDVTFNWTEEMDIAFNELKRQLTHAPVLKLPDPRKPFVLHTDASALQVCAVLLQRDSPEEGLRPIVYLSKMLDRHQRNYATLEKECFAMVWAIKELRRYLFGVSFIVQTDHRPLQWLMSKPEQSAKTIRWALTLQEYDFTIIYGPGKDNVVADALSRLECQETTVKNEFREILTEEVSFPVVPVFDEELLNENLIGRTVAVPGIWWNTSYARRHGIEKLITRRTSTTSRRRYNFC